MANRIKTIAIVTALAGILAEASAFMSFIPDTTVKLFPLLKGYLSFLNLSFFNMGILTYHNFDNGLETNFINLFFYSLLLVGALAYHFSKQKETRLIRFFFSITFVSHVFLLSHP